MMNETPIVDASTAPVVGSSAVAPKPKQYLIMADETMMMFLGKIMPSLLFVNVEGMAVKDNADYMLLVNPLPKQPVPESVPVPSDPIVEAV